MLPNMKKTNTTTQAGYTITLIYKNRCKYVRSKTIIIMQSSNFVYTVFSAASDVTGNVCTSWTVIS